MTALTAVKIYVTFRDRILLVDKPDWTFTLEFCITHGEGNVGIIIACVPTLRGLVSPGVKSRQGSDPPGRYVSSNPSINCTSISGGWLNDTPSDTRPWYWGLNLDKDELLPKPSSDVLMTTAVKANSSPVDDDIEQNFHQRFSEPPVQQNTGIQLWEELENDSSGNQRGHVYRVTPLLPPSPVPALMRTSGIR